MEALAISWGLDNPDNVFYDSENSHKNQELNTLDQTKTMSDYEEQDSPIQTPHSKYTHATPTPTEHSSHTSDTNRTRSTTVSSGPSSFHTAPLSHTHTDSLESLQTVHSSRLDSSYKSARGSSVFSHPDSLRSWARSSNQTQAEVHQEDNSSVNTGSCRTKPGSSGTSATSWRSTSLSSRSRSGTESLRTSSTADSTRTGTTSGHGQDPIPNNSGDGGTTPTQTTAPSSRNSTPPSNSSSTSSRSSSPHSTSSASSIHVPRIRNNPEEEFHPTQEQQLMDARARNHNNWAREHGRGSPSSSDTERSSDNPNPGMPNCEDSLETPLMDALKKLAAAQAKHATPGIQTSHGPGPRGHTQKLGQLQLFTSHDLQRLAERATRKSISEKNKLKRELAKAKLK